MTDPLPGTVYQGDCLDDRRAGVILHEWMVERELEDSDVAKRLGITVSRLHRLITGDIWITQALAARLRRLTGIPRADWLRRQRLTGHADVS